MDLLQQTQQLKSFFTSLRTFNDVARWDNDATNLARSIDSAIYGWRSQLDSVNSQLASARQQRAAQPFFKRLFGGRGNENQLQGSAASISAAIESHGAALNELLELVDYTPNDETERKALLKELRAEKKELNAEKRELGAQKREVNRQARNASANAGRIIFFYDAKVAASERRAIRRQRVRELAPFEDAIQGLERQLRDIEQRIAWVERFGAD